MLRHTFIRRFHSAICLQSQSKSTVIKDLLDNSATFDDLKDNSPDNDWSTLPYPEGTKVKHEQFKEPGREKTDPRDTSIILFPGQGAQHVGMCKNLVKFPEARHIFALASHVLK